MRMPSAIFVLMIAIIAGVSPARAQLSPPGPRQEGEGAKIVISPSTPQVPPVSAPPAAMVPAAPDAQRAPLFGQVEMRRVEALARKHGFILPPFEFRVPDKGLPETIRRFVGVWVDETGKNGRGRRHLVIITGVGPSDEVEGYRLYGPPDRSSFNQLPAGATLIRSRIEGARFAFTNPAGTSRMTITLSNANVMHYAFANEKGQATTRTLVPVWRLIAAERESGR